MGLVTPEAVLLELDTAGLGSRLVAIVLDGLVLFVASLALAFAGAGLAQLSGLGSAAAAVAIFAVFVLRLMYPAVLESRWRGRTLGKAALGLRVVTDEGAPIRFRHALVRAAVGIFEMELTGGSVALLAVLVSRRNQRLGDMAAGTIVVRERSAAGFTESVRFHPVPGTEAYVTTLDVTGLGPAEYGTVRSFLLRAHTLAPDVRSRLAGQIASPLAARMHHSPPPGMAAEVFLVSLAAAVQERSRATQPRDVGAAASVAALPDPVLPSADVPPPVEHDEQGAFRPPA